MAAERALLEALSTETSPAPEIVMVLPWLWALLITIPGCNCDTMMLPKADIEREPATPEVVDTVTSPAVDARASGDKASELVSELITRLAAEATDRVPTVTVSSATTVPVAHTTSTAPPEVNPETTRPAPETVTVPLPPSTRLVPTPTVIRSEPLPPTTALLPPPASMVSAPAVSEARATIVWRAPSVPKVTVPSSPKRISAPEPVVRVSAPPPPKTYTVPLAAPIRVSAPASDEVVNRRATRPFACNSVRPESRVT